MATSGSVNFAATRTQLIRQAALHLKAIDANITMSADMEADFNFHLNALVKMWAAQDMHVWTTREATLFPKPGQVKYTLSSASTDHCTESYVQTTLSAAEASGQTVISVTSSAGMTAADNVGIVMDDGTLHWSTIASVDSATQITIDDATDDDAASGNAVFAYTTKITKPLKIVGPRRHTISSARETQLDDPMARFDYNALPDKTGAGQINQVWYDRQLAAGYLYLWRVPSTVTDLLKFTWHRPIEDFDNASDNPDLPQEWISALTWNLALQMSAQFDTPNDRYQIIKDRAAETLGAATLFDREQESIFFQPDHQGR